MTVPQSPASDLKNFIKIFTIFVMHILNKNVFLIVNGNFLIVLPVELNEEMYFPG